MYEITPIVVGLDIGTSKVCAVVGEFNDSGGLNIVGVGQAKSRGVRKGEVVDATLAGEDIRNAIVEAEQMADIEIRSVYLGVTGGHIRGLNNRGFHQERSSHQSPRREQGFTRHSSAFSSGWSGWDRQPRRDVRCPR